MELFKGNEKEKWKPVKDYEKLYEVSNFGNVKSLSKFHKTSSYSSIGYRSKEKILKKAINTHGYVVVSLCKESKLSTKQVHRLVAEAFIINPENKPCINHIDGNKENNHISNLEWCTYSENMKHGNKIGLYPKKRSCGKRRPRTDEEKALISLKTKEAMKNPVIREKLSRAKRRVG